MSKFKKTMRTIQTKSAIFTVGGKEYRMRLSTLALFVLAVVLLIIAIVILIIVNSCSPSDPLPAEPATPAAVADGDVTGGDVTGTDIDIEAPEDPDMPGDDTEPDEPGTEPVDEPEEPEASPEPEEPAVPVQTGSPAFTETVKLNYTGPIVKVIQQRLVDLYFMEYPSRTNGVGSVTEKFGSTTQRALRMFQERNGMIVTGECDETTYNKLLSASANPYVMQMNDKWKMVEAIQTALKEQGYLEKVTGYCGTDTIDAVKSFQKNKGLAADGIAGKGTLSVLFGY